MVEPLFLDLDRSSGSLLFVSSRSTFNFLVLLVGRTSFGNGLIESEAHFDIHITSSFDSPFVT